MCLQSERLKRHNDEEVGALKKEYGNTIEDLKSSLSMAENELARIESYRRDKDYYDKKMANLEKASVQERQQSFDALAEQERWLFQSLYWHKFSYFMMCLCFCFKTVLRS